MKSGLYALFFLAVIKPRFLVFTPFLVVTSCTCRYICRYAVKALCAIPTNLPWHLLSAAPDVKRGFDGYGILRRGQWVILLVHLATSKLMIRQL